MKRNFALGMVISYFHEDDTLLGKIQSTCVWERNPLLLFYHTAVGDVRACHFSLLILTTAFSPITDGSMDEHKVIRY
jgi:hypothetical protein